jgi:hypothetical protein
MKKILLGFAALGVILIADNRAQAQYQAGQGYYTPSVQVMPEPSLSGVPYLYYGNSNMPHNRGYYFGTGNAYPMLINNRGAYPYTTNGGYLYYGRGGWNGNSNNGDRRWR